MRKLLTFLFLLALAGAALYLLRKSEQQADPNTFYIRGVGRVRKQTDPQAADEWRAYFDRLAEEGLGDDEPYA